MKFKDGQLAVQIISIKGKKTAHLTRVLAVGSGLMFCQSIPVPYDPNTGKEAFPMYPGTTEVESEIVPLGKW